MIISHKYLGFTVRTQVTPLTKSNGGGKKRMKTFTKGIHRSALFLIQTVNLSNELKVLQGMLTNL